MRSGLVQTLAEGELKTKRRVSRFAGSSSSRSGPNGGGENGGGGPQPPENDQQNIDKAKIVAWFVLLIVLMTFGGLVGAYVVVATNSAIEWKPFPLPSQVWVSTAVILISSGFYEAGKKALPREKIVSTRVYFVAAAVFGFAFIASQFLAWLALSERGFYLSGNPYAGFFYLLTAAHALHVFGGIVALGAIITRTWYPTSIGSEMLYRLRLVRAVGWYWHFIGGIWLVLLAALGFWK